MEVLDYGKETGARLTRDLGVHYWKMSVQDQITHVSFSQCYVNIGREILCGMSMKELSMNVF